MGGGTPPAKKIIFGKYLNSEGVLFIPKCIYCKSLMYFKCIFGVSGENLQYDWVNVGGVGRGVVCGWWFKAFGRERLPLLREAIPRQ